MELLLKNNPKLELRKLYKRSGGNIKPSRVASACQRSPKHNININSEITTINAKRVKPTIVTYPVSGENTVAQVSYIEPNQDTNQGIVWINQSQYFENVPAEVWNYCVGNYCVCQKWLKVREGTTLNRQSIQDYQRLVMLVSETIDLMNNVDSRLVNIAVR
jgi:hypothetical protein